MGAAPALASASASAGSGSGSQTYAGLVDPSAVPWWKNRRLLALNGWIALLLITSTTNGYDGSMMNGLQSLTQWEDAFNNPSGGMLGLLNAIQNIGSLCAYPFAPYVTDGLGRRPAILLGAALMLVATALQSAAHSVHMFIGARFLIGFGLTFAASAAPLLVTEIAHPSQRGQATSLYNSLWSVLAPRMPSLTFGTFTIQSSWAWRIPSILQGLPSAVQVGLIWFCPESPRWLVSKGREAQALKTLAYYHANGNAQDPLVEYEFEEIKAAIKLDREVAADVGWLSLVRTPGNRKRMRIIVAIAFFSQWSGNGLVSYYLKRVCDSVGITDPTMQLLINGVLNIWNFFVAVAAGLLCDRVGRRRLFITSTVGMLVFWIIQTICFAEYSKHGNPATGRTVIAMIFVYYAFYDIAFTPLIVSYSVEILPFAIRAKGFTVFSFAVSLSLIFNQYVNPIALNALGWKYYLVYACWLAFEAVFVFVYIIETKNRTLEETAALFDGADTVAQIAQQAAEQAGTSTSTERDSQDPEKHGGSVEKAEVETESTS
ncbi:MFS sugar transporter [Heterobasidion irregulare TC 32-1]|uniref:MFS sugar transporter n=1 Tax=Heterobasidion irregulare (strain TC 32-1) TaxID=747525 RepID=W4K7V7_HETIT|nr:MFS sugar transporter [Heterobasidion irregulare TC 32-1]ETW81156.1 MFS sugar transporter [Heterobasidion irregulare TC 32-1]